MLLIKTLPNLMLLIKTQRRKTRMPAPKLTKRHQLLSPILGSLLKPATTNPHPLASDLLLVSKIGALLLVWELLEETPSLWN